MLTREDRMQVDAELAPHLAGAGDRRSTIRPAPDTMSNVTGLLPVAQGVAVYASLHQHAESLRGQGDIRTLAQIMADTY